MRVPGQLVLLNLCLTSQLVVTTTGPITSQFNNVVKDLTRIKNQLNPFARKPSGSSSGSKGKPSYKPPGASKPSYKAPGSSYGAPSSSYGAPSSSFGATSSSYGAPAGGNVGGGGGGGGGRGDASLAETHKGNTRTKTTKQHNNEV